MTAWSDMHRCPRITMAKLDKAAIPTSAGAYALYRSGEPMYVGKAKCLRDRIWENHSGRGLGMGTSALRRNIAEHLGIAKASDIKVGRHRVTLAEAAQVRAWLDDCEIAWRECAGEAEAKKLEDEMKAEHKPLLTKA